MLAMDLPVVVRTEQAQVALTGRPTVCPVHDVVRVAVNRQPTAVGKHTALVAQVQQPAQSWRTGAHGPAVVQRLTVAAEQHRHDPRITGDAPGVGRVEPRAEAPPARPAPAVPTG